MGTMIDLSKIVLSVNFHFSKVVKSEVEFGLHYKGNNKITELRTILQRESQNS
jgi:hypothetical protein